MDSEFNGYGTFSRNGIIVIGLSYMLSELVFTGHSDGKWPECSAGREQ